MLILQGLVLVNIKVVCLFPAGDDLREDLSATWKGISCQDCRDREKEIGHNEIPRTHVNSEELVKKLDSRHESIIATVGT